MDGGVPRRASYGVYFSQFMRFAGINNHVTDFNVRNKCLNRVIVIIKFENHFRNFITYTMN